MRSLSLPEPSIATSEADKRENHRRCQQKDDGKLTDGGGGRGGRILPCLFTAVFLALNTTSRAFPTTLIPSEVPGV